MNKVESDVTLFNASTVAVHPLVLLSVVDHFARVNSRHMVPRRVVGLLMGNYVRDKEGVITLDITNSFAVPFDEDPDDPSVWFFDSNFADEMFTMQKQVFPTSQLVGWYSSGPSICHNDALLHTQIADRFAPNPVFVVVNTNTSKKGVPALAYIATEARDGSPIEFRNVPTSLGSSDMEEIGVDQLLRDITDSTLTSLSVKISDRQLSLAQLETLLGALQDYLQDVATGKLPVSQDILAVVQELLSYQPYVHQLKTSESMVVNANDEALATFVAATSRCIMTLYNVILNRRQVAREVAELRRKDADEKKKKKEAEEAKDKESKLAEKEKEKNTEKDGKGSK